MDEAEHKPGVDELAQNALMQMQDKLYALIRMLMIRNSQDALDVLQDTNAAILEQADRYDPSKPPWPWFRGIALNQVKLYFRKKAHTPLDCDSDLMDSLAGDIEECRFFRGVELEEYLEALKRCMEKLPPLKRELLQAHYMDGEKLVSLAAQYHVSFRSLTQLFYRMRAALQKCIQSAVKTRTDGAPSVDDDRQPKGDFSERLELLLEDNLPPEERCAFEREIASSHAKRLAYMEQVFLDAFLECRKGNLFTESGGKRPVFRVSARSVSIAAALAALLLGGAWLLRRSEPPGPAAENHTISIALESTRKQPDAVKKLLPAEPQPKPTPVFAETNQLAVVTPQKEKTHMNPAPIKPAAIVKAVAVAAAATIAVASPQPVKQAQSVATALAESSEAVSLDTRTVVTSEKPETVDLSTRTVFTTESSTPKSLKTTKFRGLVVMLM